MIIVVANGQDASMSGSASVEELAELHLKLLSMAATINNAMVEAYQAKLEKLNDTTSINPPVLSTISS